MCIEEPTVYSEHTIILKDTYSMHRYLSQHDN